MKIATFNINDINKRLANLLRWLGEARPDVVCLQELKAADRDFPAAAWSRPDMRACGAGRNRGTGSRSWRAAPSRC
jgi:exodeoxyribonuclease-3